MDKWEIKKTDGKIYGPVDTSTLIQWIEEKRVLADDLISPAGENRWGRAVDTPPFKEIFAPSIPGEVIKEEEKEEIICPKCGKKWDTDTVLCTNCGTNLKSGKQINSIISPLVQGDSPPSLISVLCIKEALRILKSNPWNLAGITFLYFLVNGFTQQLPILGWLMQIAIGPVLTVGFYTVCLKKAKGEESNVNTLFTPFSFFVPTLVVVALYGIIVAVGNMFFLIPGIFFTVALSFSFFIVSERQSEPVEALRESFDLTQGLRWKILAIFVLGGLINILGLLALGIGILFTFPVTFLALATLYNGVKSGEFAEARYVTSKKEILLALLPVVILLGLMALLIVIGFAKILPLFKNITHMTKWA